MQSALTTKTGVTCILLTLCLGLSVAFLARRSRFSKPDVEIVSSAESGDGHADSIPPAHGNDGSMIDPMSSAGGERTSLAQDPPSLLPESEPVTDWRETYSKYSLGKVVDEIRAIRVKLEEVTVPYYQECYDKGNFEIIGFYNPGEKVSVPTEYFDELCNVTFLKDGRMVRAVLPRDKFPDAYVMQEKVQWLMEREMELKLAPVSDLRLNIPD